jgi:tRNA(Ile)-lysidine synthase TilS/MesJ
MKKFGLYNDTPLLVAVSGGKDSLAAWDILNDLGYTTKGLHINLSIEGFSESSVEAVENFARPRNLEWVEYPLYKIFGYTVPEIRARTRRKICSLCGLLKRQMLNRMTIREGFGALVVGHNLDDEAGRLLGNFLRHRTQHLEKVSPFLPSTHPRLPAKLKPLYRLESSEIRTYCTLKGIVPLDSKCPMSRGATSHIIKEALDFLEYEMPGTKRDFLFHYVKQKASDEARSPFVDCRQCGEPSYDGLCSVCNLKAQLEAKDNPVSDDGLL